ncbi:GNAT family N-acetyltransferase [Propionivibrio soli]|uniref:GNAT family N-acetyltransferase n=1 Tax=Propionivibrio soli TaxID=2976531 RepID=UPI0021E717B9|nr:GNAT family protein [Propionivibrio soli]
MLPFPELQTKRLRLRELDASDAPAIFKIYSNSSAMPFFGTDPINSLAEAEKTIAKFSGWRSLPNPGIRWGLEEKSTGRLIGSCGLFAWNRAWHRCTTGYELEFSARGQGFMNEALRVALCWGFTEMQLNRIDAQIHPGNHASLRLAEKLGFRREGCLRQAGYWGGEFRDLLQFGLLRTDWSAVENGTGIAAG